MKFSYNWLKTWIDLKHNAEELAHLLTMSGLEVEEIIKAAPDFSNVVIAEVVNIKKHPNADRLKITHVNVGNTNELIQIVCGAPNVIPGIKVPCALPEAILPENLHIKPTQMRGIESGGMLCSAQELGLHDDVDGLFILPKDAPIGENIRDYLQLDDKILEIKSTPNRADCLSIKGIAREVAALTKSTLIPVQMTAMEPKDSSIFPTYIEAPDACGRFITQMIKNINIDIPTPLWMKQRLERSGIRSIDFLIDVGNYVMLELGQPLHLFDFDKLSQFICVRFAKKGEQLLCLNGKKVNLSDNTLIIADQNGPLSIAGLMGGEASSITKNTKNILIESAFFYPDVIAGKARQYGFASESSFRFERGVDYHLQRSAIERATELILTYAGGMPAPINMAIGNLPQKKEILLRPARAEKILGIPLDKNQIQAELEQLGFNPKIHQDGFKITSPSFRFDINIEIDLIEEIARVFGYENIKPKTSYGKLTILKQPDGFLTQQQIIEKISALGYQEVINYAFVDEKWEMDFYYNKNPIKVINPIASHMNVMRSSLIASLVNNLVYNLNRKHSRVRIFEIAKVFRRNEKNALIQNQYISALSFGNVLPEQWGVKSTKIDFFDVKNDLIQLLSKVQVQFIAKEHPALHPGKSALIIHENDNIGFIGELHPRLVQKYDLPLAPIVFEIKYDIIAQQVKILYNPISKYQPVYRDLAFIVPENISAEKLITTLKQNQSNSLQSIQVFDLYKGVGIPKDHKSMAVKIIFQAQEKTLQDEEIDQLIHQLINNVQPLGIILRH